MMETALRKAELGSRIVQMALNFAMKPEKLDGWMERLQQYMTNAGYSGSGPEKGLDHKMGHQ